MVDQEHAGAVLVAHRAHDGGEVRDLGLGEPGRGLVHQDEARLGGERARDAELALVAVRQRATAVSSARAAEAERAEQTLARQRASRPDAPTPSAATSTFSRTVETLEGVPVLERAREPGAPAPVRRPAGHVGVLELDAAGRRKVEAVITFTSVVLPAPFGPIRPTTSLRASSRSTSASACTPSNDRETPTARSGPDGRRLCGSCSATRLASGRCSPATMR